MNLAIDIGNTRMKWALFDGGRMSDHGSAEASQLAEVCRSHDWQRGILCATGAITHWAAWRVHCTYSLPARACP